MNDSIKEALRDVVNNCDKESRVSSQMEISAYIYSIEQQNKAWSGMVELLTEKIKRLEEQSSCDGCKYLTEFGCNVCSVCRRHPKCVDRYEPKETK